MWIMTKIGFFSVVEKPAGKMCIRARKLADLVAFQRYLEIAGKIHETRNSDYRFRMFMDRHDFKMKFPKLVELINYSNFKDAVKKVNPHREQIYHKVWSDLLPIEKEE